MGAREQPVIGVRTRATAQPIMGTCPLSSTCTRTGALGTPDTCYYAAHNEHWDCLQYAVDNKCPEVGGIRRRTRRTPPMKCQQSIDDPLSITRCPKKSYINPTNETAALPTWLWSPGEPRPARPPTATSAHPRTSSPAGYRRTRPTHRGSESPRRSPRWRQPEPRLKTKKTMSVQLHVRELK